MRMNERTSGLASVVFQAATRRLGGMSASGTDVSPSGSAWPSGVSPIVPFQRTACRHA